MRCVEPGVMAVAELASARLAWAAFGAPTAPALLLVRGLGTQSIEWPAALVEAFVASGRRVLIFDNRDCGLSSDHEGESYGLGDMARDCVELLDALAIDRADVLGMSMGGMIVQRLAIEHGDRFRRFVSIMSSTGAPDLPGPSDAAREALLAPAPGDLDAAIRQNAAHRRIFGSPGFPMSPELCLTLAERALRRAWRPAGVGRQYAAILADGSRRSALGAVRAPFLVIHGADDPLVPLAAGEDTAAAVPGAELEVIPGMGHDLPEGVHGRIAERVLGFLGPV